MFIYVWVFVLLFILFLGLCFRFSSKRKVLSFEDPKDLQNLLDLKQRLIRMRLENDK